MASLFLHSLLSKRKLLVTLPVLLYGTYIFIALITLSYTTDSMRGFQWCSTMVGNLLFLFFVINAIRTPKQIRLPIVLWLGTTLAIGAFTIYQWHSDKAVVQGDRFENSGYRSTDDRFSTIIIDYAEFDSIGAVKRVLGATSHPAVYGINIILTETAEDRWKAEHGLSSVKDQRPLYLQQIRDPLWALLTVAAEARRRLVSIWLFSAGRLHTVEAPTNSIAATIRATNENPSQPAINTPAGIDLQLLAAPGTELFPRLGPPRPSALPHSPPQRHIGHLRRTPHPIRRCSKIPTLLRRITQRRTTHPRNQLHRHRHPRRPSHLPSQPQMNTHRTTSATLPPCSGRTPSAPS